MARNHPFGTKTDGVFFTEASELAGQRVIGEVSWKAAGQNQDLRYVKAELAKKVRDMGGNALVRFEYGQRGRHWLGSVGIVDSENWFGSGVAVAIDPELVDDVPDRASGILPWKGW
jgi:hypothetical protein